MPISKLKSGSITGTFDASKIGSGTFADARIAASNVSQHATSFDDNKIINDLSTLGLRVHTQENLTASNTNSQYIDVFQDATGVTGLTNATRNASEYINTLTTTTTTPTNTHDADQTGVDGDYTWYKWTDTSGTAPSIGAPIESAKSSSISTTICADSAITKPQL